MATLTHSAKGLGLVLVLNWDRLLFLAAIGVALMGSTWLTAL